LKSALDAEFQRARDTTRSIIGGGGDVRTLVTAEIGTDSDFNEARFMVFLEPLDDSEEREFAELAGFGKDSARPCGLPRPCR